MTDIISVACSKGGVAKTTTTFALAAAAQAKGIPVLIVDLDPSRGISGELGVAASEGGVFEVLTEGADVIDVLQEPHPGMLLLAGSRRLDEAPVKQDALVEVLRRAAAVVDLVIVDCRPTFKDLWAPLLVATRIVIPSTLDTLSMRQAAFTAEEAVKLGRGNAVAGILPTIVPRPVSALARTFLEMLDEYRLALTPHMHQTVRWKYAIGQGSFDRFADLRQQAEELLQHVLERQVAEGDLRAWIDLWSEVPGA